MRKKETVTRVLPYYVVRRADTVEELEILLNTLRGDGFAIHYVFPGYTVVAWMSAL